VFPIWRIAAQSVDGYRIEVAGGIRETTMELHPPSMWVFIASLIIAVIAVISVFTPISYISTYGFWVAILAYIVLALGNMVKT
jgi:hypothetical protein